MMVAPAICGLTSCGVFNEDLDPCPQGVVLKFVYDYNMEFADAFNSQVDCLTVLVYDDRGNLVEERTETTDALASKDYRMTLNLDEGSYTFITYGGLACEDASFRFVTPPTQGSTFSSVQVELLPQYVNAATGTNLHPLFYGKLKAAVPASVPGSGYVEHTISLIKDTNNLRIILQQANGEPIDHRDFEFYVTVDNTLMNWRNDLMPVAVSRVNPWALGTEHTAIPEETIPGINYQVNAAYAEFSMGRLVGTLDTPQPRLVIRRAGFDYTILDIPLIPYLMLLKSQQFNKMSDQEFLDRESRWSMIFFLDANQTWLKTRIVINDWVVRINNIEY